MFLALLVLFCPLVLYFLNSRVPNGMNWVHLIDILFLSVSVFWEDETLEWHMMLRHCLVGNKC